MIVKKPSFIVCIFALTLMFGSLAKGQEAPNQPSFRTWSVGLNAGMMAPFSPLGGKEEFGDWVPKLGYGINVKKQFNTYFSLRADVFAGNLKAYRPNFIKKYYFESKLHYVANFSAVFNMFSLNMFKQYNALQFYASAGGGVAKYSATQVNLFNAPNRPTTIEKKEVINMVIPVGLGARYRLHDGLNLNFGWTINFANADDLDNTVADNDNDRFSYVFGGVEFALGKGKQLSFFSPVAATYDEVLEAKKLVSSLRSDLEAQKEEIARLNFALTKLLTDSDGDGVAAIKPPITAAEDRVVKEAIDNVTFAFGKATIEEASYPSLNKLAELSISKNFTIKIAGHADDKGSAKSNMRLSKKRAEAVKAYLVARGVNASKIEATGYGEDQPIESNQSPNGRKLNRRVEFTLY